MLKPPTYDGQSSWSMYRRQFETAARANGWTPQEMATSLVISLRGQALEILQSIPEEQQNDYDRIVGALEIRKVRGKSDDRRTNGGDRRTVRRQNDDDKRTETRQRGVIRKFASHSKSVHKMLKPPTYDGQSSWSMYRRQFEAAAKANGWTSQEMATSLVISLRGQALEILQSILEEQQNDYDRIVGALEIRYGHKYLRQVYQSQIKRDKKLLQLWENWAPTALLQGQIKVSVKNELTRSTARFKIKIQESRQKEVERRKWTQRTPDRRPRSKSPARNSENDK
ncbi:hypothetical protein NQ318_007171 [Aromia moschata]|uniref:Uncharacterized protein n=1 Tax=Aromia moschata TaxID=1265417 RepID=A0AAV8XCD2_9CUCU|nr:hypothetical protein NQ318_007171 [Aromia moschata]